MQRDPWDDWCAAFDLPADLRTTPVNWFALAAAARVVPDARREPPSHDKAAPRTGEPRQVDSAAATHRAGARRPAGAEAGAVSNASTAQGSRSPAPGGALSRAPSVDPAPAADARQLAATAPDLEALAALVRDFDGCPLKQTARNACVFRGARDAALVVIGEAPGANEDREGKPFVGRAGQLLDKMLAAAGIDETGVHITNIVYWRPPGNRTPTPAEVEICRPFLERQIELVGPRVIICLGKPAANQILGTAQGILKIRGKWQDMKVGRHRARVMASLHPAYLLRSPAAKELAWRDWCAVSDALTSAA